MMEMITRPQWGARPANSITPSDPDKLDGVGVHWFGSPNGVSDHAKCDDLMRSVQNAHMAGEFNDIAYSFVVCQHGKIFEGRGWNRQTGANGYEDVNKRYGAICCMYGTGDNASEFTEPVKRAIANVIQGYRARGAGTYVGRHGYWTGSACPGPYIGAWIDAKGYNAYLGAPPVTTSPIPDWLDDWMYWKFVNKGDPAKKPSNVPMTIPDWAWDHAAAVHRIATHSGMAEGEEQWIDWKRDGADPAKRPGVPTNIPQPWWDDLSFVNVQASA